jgi:hypothetical protein
VARWSFVVLSSGTCLGAYWVNPGLGVFAYLFNGLILWVITHDLGTTWWKMLLGWLPALVSPRVRDWVVRK